MRLYLVRHGDAVSEQTNNKRPLSTQGIADARRISTFLKNARVDIGAFYHSTKLRAQQTAEIIQKTVTPKVSLQEKENLSPNDPIDPILREIEGLKNDTMIVSHLPFISLLTSRLVVGDAHKTIINFLTCTVVVLEKGPGKNWNVISVMNPESL